jgi:hypothetical protein
LAEADGAKGASPPQAGRRKSRGKIAGSNPLFIAGTIWKFLQKYKFTGI